MSDLIDRQDAIDAVCMEWCNVKHQNCEHPFDDEKDDYYWCDGCETALRTLPDLPSAQPEIIRCKDCYWWTKQKDSLQGRCDRYGHYPTGAWFCASAERREE